MTQAIYPTSPNSPSLSLSLSFSRLLYTYIGKGTKDRDYGGLIRTRSFIHAPDVLYYTHLLFVIHNGLADFHSTTFAWLLLLTL